MPAVAEAYRLIEAGGDPRQSPALDYGPFLPLLLTRHRLETMPFLIRYAQTATVLRYTDLDYRLIQRQVKEQLQMEKQDTSGRYLGHMTRLFEVGSPEERARVVLLEITRMLQEDARDAEERNAIVDQKRQQQRLQPSFLLSSPICRQEMAIILPMLVLRCRHPAVHIQNLVRSLRSIREPSQLVVALVANCPSEFSPTVDSLLDPFDPYLTARPILLRLCKLADHRTWNVRQRLVDRKQLPNLALELTIEHCHDETSFMNRILQGQPEWLTSGPDPVTRTSLASIMEFLFSSLNDELTAKQPDHVAVNRLLRILSGMIGLMNLTLSSEQLEISLLVLEMGPLEPSTVGIKICLLLMAASQLLKYGTVRVERVLHRLMNCPDSPQVLLLHIFFQSGQLLRIDDFASKVLSMNLVIPRAGLMDLGAIFTSLFSNKELGTCALALGRSNYAHTGNSGIKGGEITSPRIPASDRLQSELRSVANFCVSHLLKIDIFHRSGMDVRAWVMQQIQDATVPLDTNMVPLLRAYTTAISHSDHITRIPEGDIRALFRNPCEDLTPAKALLVLYMLLNNDVCIANLGSDNMERNREYDSALLEYVQIRKVLLYVQNYQDGVAFRTVQPMFLKLVNAQFPELFDVTTLLMEEGLSTTAATTAASPPGQIALVSSLAATLKSVRARSSGVALFLESHYHTISRHIEYPEAAVKAYHAFQRLSQEEKQSLAQQIIHASLPSLLDPKSHPTVMEAFKNTWDQLNRVMPHDLWGMTIHALLAQSSAPTQPAAPPPMKIPTPSAKTFVPAWKRFSSPSPTGNNSQPFVQSQNQRPLHQHPGLQHQNRSAKPLYTFDQLVQDPLLLFKVDPRVGRTPTIFRLFIQILGAVMVGSRHYFRKHFQASQAILQSHQSRNPFQSHHHHSIQKNRQFKDANLTALLHTQDVTLIQFLLEICQARPEDLEQLESEPMMPSSHRRLSKDSGDRLAEDRGSLADRRNSILSQGVGSASAITPADKEGVNEVLKEIRVVTFNFLHQLFIDHTIYSKLIHFEGYSMDLIPSVVSGVDSIHVCFDFLPELLISNPVVAVAGGGNATPMVSGPAAGGDATSGVSSAAATIASTVLGGGLDSLGASETAAQLFSLRFAAQLCERYPLPHTLKITMDYILPRLRTMAIRSGFAKEVLESARVLARAFPHLSSDIIQILQETSGLKDQAELQRTVEAIELDMEDAAVWDKSVL
ncbi:integrator complex subunit 2 [Entomortierella parvispora]|uniref:Integrator complex subunit 2 n=1 Tax=Entomortierella parvispora TaxID=205924 RepID=A0A9P3HA38_9FUNG|nr:integrator complex subunit 2 [Entomortierella parvispora]